MNSPRIQLHLPADEAPRPAPRWKQLGLLENPFPESGVATSIDYNDHQEAEIARINAWLERCVDPDAPRWGPLLIKGSIGVGKTHVLRRIERAIEEAGRNAYPGKVGVSYHLVTGSGAKNLLLADLLLEALTAPLPGHDDSHAIGEMPLVQALLAALRENLGDPATAANPLAAIPRTSPLRAPLRALLAESAPNPARDQAPDQAAEIEQLFCSWLMRRELTTRQSERLGVSGKLQGEGEAVRAYVHLFRLAHAAIHFRAWILMIDQIEDLWRHREITPLKRARFFTDLRTLIDEGLEGAPIAVMLAWNTEVVSVGSLGSLGSSGSLDVEQRLGAEYRALWSRLPEPVDLPMLQTEEQARAFAAQYIEAGREREPGARAKMLAALTQEEPQVRDRIPVEANGRIGQRTNQRAWLRALRAWADESPPGEGRSHPAAGKAPKPSPKIGLKAGLKTRPKTK